jgi:hypothetical protein
MDTPTQSSLDKPDDFDEGLAALAAQLAREEKSVDEIDSAFQQYAAAKGWPPPGEVRDVMISHWRNQVVDAQLKIAKAQTKARHSAVAEDQTSVGCLGGVLNYIITVAMLTFILIVLNKTNPSQKDFEAFAAKEGFVMPSVSRKDLEFASYYEIQGNFTGEKRAYIGIFHTFIRAPDIHSAQP